MKILQLTVHLFPNVGGVETHLKDFVDALIKKGYTVFVLAYQPLSTKISWKFFEKGKNLKILRIPWLRGFFEKLVSDPPAEFIYLVPGLFIVIPFVVAFFRPNVIHAHGLIAGSCAVFWGKFFKVRVVISLHSFYSFPKKGLYRFFVSFILRNSDSVLSLSKKSDEEVSSLGVKNSKVGVFTYWVDLEKFKKIPLAKEKLNWKGKFVVLFVGRLILEKGLDILLKSVKMWDKKITLAIIGSGSLEKDILAVKVDIPSLNFIGRVEQSDLPLYYSAADLVIVPSTSEEGFGRVIIESLACETPVVASNRGAIPEALDDSVGLLIDVTPQNLERAVSNLYKNPKILTKLSKNARSFVEKKYSERNIDKIISSY